MWSIPRATRTRWRSLRWWCASRSRRILDGHGIGSGPSGHRANRRRALERHVPGPSRGRAGGAAPTPSPALPPSAHDVLREARLLRALEPTPVRVPAVLAACDDESVLGVPFYVMEEVHGSVITADMPAALDNPEERTAPELGAGRPPGRDPRGGLAGLRARGLRQADRLPRTAAAALQRPLGAQQDPRAAGGGGGARLAGRQPARVAALDDRPRRLPAGQRDGGRRRRRRGWWRSSTGSCPRSAIRWPISATSRSPGPSPATRRISASAVSTWPRGVRAS